MVLQVLCPRAGPETLKPEAEEDRASGLRVQGVGVVCLGFRVSGFGFRVSGFRVSGFGIGVFTPGRVVQPGTPCSPELVEAPGFWFPTGAGVSKALNPKP